MKANRRMRKISLAALTVLDLNPVEQIYCAHECGYQAVGLRLIPATPEEKHFSLMEDPSRLRDVKNALNSTGIEVLDIEIFRIRPDIHLEEYLPFLEMGAELGARNMLVAGNDPDQQRLADQWGKLSEISQSFDIKPHMEAMPWTDVKSYLESVALVDSGPEWGAALIDPIHFFRAGGECAQVLKSHTNKMGYVQFTDAPAEQPVDMAEILRQAREDRIPPGLGGLPLLDLLKSLPNDLPISIEVPLTARWGCQNSSEKARLVIQHTIQLLNAIPN